MSQDKDEKALADRCIPFLEQGPLNSLELRARLREKHDAAEIYRALKKDERVEGFETAMLTTFELREAVR